MRYKSLYWLALGAWIGAIPPAARADYLSSAKAALNQGDLRTAHIELRNAVRNDPQNAEAHYWLGWVSFELGDPVASEREAVAAFDRGFDPHQTVALLSQSLLTQAKYQELLDKLRPDSKDPLLDAEILVARGYAQAALKLPEEAQRSIADAERIAPNAVGPLLADARMAMARADLATAETKINSAIAAQPRSIEALLAKAQLLRLRNRVADAVVVLDELVTDQPSVTQARLDRAALLLLLGRNEAARTDIVLVLKASPSNVQAIYLRAVLQAESRDYKAADADLDRISGFISRIPRAFYLQAVVKEQLGQLEQAEQAAQKYLARAPNDLAAYKVLARIQSARHQPDQAADTLAGVAATGHADAEAYDLLGRAYAATGRGTEAVQAFQNAEGLAPNDVGVQTRLAAVRVGMGEADLALGDLEHTLQLAPKLPAVSEALFFAALATGDTAKAEAAMIKIQAAQGQTEVVGNLAGLLQLARTDFAGAQAVFRDLVRQYPDFMAAKVNLARVDMILGEPTEAERILTAILRQRAAAEPALSMLTSDYVRTNRLPGAVELLEQAHLAQPNQASVTVALGEAYMKAGTPQKALDLTAAEKRPNAGSADILSLRAAACLALGQQQDARAAYQEILQADANAIGTRRKLVALLVEQGDFESARALITAGIALNPRDYQLYRDDAAIDLTSAGIDAALATADRLQAQHGDFADLGALRGDIYLAANRPADAITAYAQANGSAPSSMLVTRLASALLRAQRADDATKLLRDWLEKHADDMVATEQLSEISIAGDKLDDAAAYLQRVLQRLPHNVVALNNLAWVYQQQGKDAPAQALARQAYVLAPGPQTEDTLGWILTKSGNARDGVTLLRQASSGGASSGGTSGVGASDPRIVYHYGVALKNIGNKDEAKKQFEAVVETKSEFKEKVEAQRMLDEMAKGT